jgi:hypothetical protein
MRAIVRSPRVLVVGNSIALYTADEGFKRLRTTPNLDVLNLGSIGCRLLPEVTRTSYPRGGVAASQSRPCRDNWALAVRLFRPDAVFLLVNDATDARREIDGHWTHPCEPAYDTVLERELRSQVRLLAAGGARVVVTTAAYSGFPYEPREWYQYDDCQNAIFRRVATSEPHAVLADIFSWICPQAEARCAAHLGPVVLRPDGVHFRDASARLVAAWLIGEAQRHHVLTHVRIDGAYRAQLASLPSP